VHLTLVVHKQSSSSRDHDQDTVLACAKYCTTGFCSIFATLPKMREECTYSLPYMQVSAEVIHPLSNYVPI